MKLNSVLKIMISVLAIALVMACLVPNFTFATDWKSVTQFDGKSDTGLNNSAQSIIGAILGVTRIIAVGVAIIMLVVLAMKYMMSAPGDRADIKKHAVVYVVGAVVLFGASGLLGIIQNFAQNI